MSEYSVEISGKYYKVDSQTILNEINNASTTSEKQEIISSYVASNKATQIDEDEYQEMQIDDEDKTEETEGTEEAYPEGFDYDSYKAYSNSTGLSKLTEDSSVDDLIAVFEKIEDKVNELDKKIASVDEDDPDEIAALLSDMTNMTIAIGELGKAAGVEFEKNGVVGKAVTSGIAGAVAVGVPAYCIATSAAAISVAVAEGAGVVAATSAAIPGPGWVVAGIAAVVAIGAGIWAYTSSKQNEEMEKKLAELQENITNTADKLNGSWDKTTEKLQKGGEAAVDEVEKDLDGLLNDEFNFDDITDVGSITKNIDKIIEAQEKLEPFYTVATTYGIEIKGLNELMEKLGTGDDCLVYAQEYLDAYAGQVSMDITDEVITDTTTLNTLHEDIAELIEDADSKGLDTSKLEALLEKIQETNQKEADDAADMILEDYTTGGGGSGAGVSGGTGGGSGGIIGTVQDMVSGSNQASDTASQVDKNSSQYTTDTSKIEEASETLKSKAQQELESYVQGIKIAGLSVLELEELYTQVSANYEELKQIEGIDCTLLVSKLEEIRQTQQVLVDNEIEAFEQRISSATTSEARMQLMTEINTMISNYSSLEVNISGAKELITQIQRFEEIAIKTKVQTYLIESGQASSVGEIAEIINKIQIDIQTSQSLGCDVSAYQEALVILNQRLDEVQKEETSKPSENITENTTNSNNTYEDNSTTDIDISQDNSTTIDDDSTTDIDITQDNSTNIGSIDNSTNIGSIDNSTNVNVEADTSRIEELLQEILDKINKTPDTPPKEQEICEPEDEIMPEDGPNEDPAIESAEEIPEEKAEEAKQEIATTTEEQEQETEEVQNSIEEPEIKTEVAETPEEPVEDQVEEPVEEVQAEPEETEQEEDEVPCENEDFVGIDNSDSITESVDSASEASSSDGPRTTAEINAGVTQQEVEEEPDESEEGKTIIEGEDGYDYELDFEEDKQ